MAVACGDKSIRLWDAGGSSAGHSEGTMPHLLWRGLQNKVTAVAWHPTEEGLLAFGTDVGRVGVYEVFSQRHAVYTSCHAGCVTGLAWRASPSDGGGGTLFSIAVDGAVWRWPAAKIPGSAGGAAGRTMSISGRTLAVGERLPRPPGGAAGAKWSAMQWTSDARCFALGTSGIGGQTDGSVEVYTPLEDDTWRLLCAHREHTKRVTTLRVLGSTSDDGQVCIYGVCVDTEVAVKQASSRGGCLRRWAAHRKSVSALSWSPHDAGLVATACAEGLSKVWGISGEVPSLRAEHRAHHGRALCIQWSAVHPTVIVTGGEDQVLRAWDFSVAGQEVGQGSTGHLGEATSAEGDAQETGASHSGQGSAGSSTPAATLAPEEHVVAEEAEVKGDAAPSHA
eukprot:gene21222-25500_t